MMVGKCCLVSGIFRQISSAQLTERQASLEERCRRRDGRNKEGNGKWRRACVWQGLYLNSRTSLMSLHFFCCVSFHQKRREESSYICCAHLKQSLSQNQRSSLFHRWLCWDKIMCTSSQNTEEVHGSLQTSWAGYSFV